MLHTMKLLSGNTAVSALWMSNSPPDDQLVAATGK